MGKIFVLLSSLFFGVSNAYWKRAILKLPFYVVIFFRGCIASSIFGILWLLDTYHYHFFSNPSIGIPADYKHLILTFLLCFFSDFGLYFFVKSLQYQKVGIVVAISSINIFSVITALVFLKETWNPIYWICILLIIVGTYFLFPSAEKHSKKKISWESIQYGFYAAFFWGVSYALFRFSIRWYGPLSFSFILEFCTTIFVFIIIVWTKNIHFIVQKKNRDEQNQFLLLAGLLLGGTFFINMAILITPITLVNILGNTTQLISLLLGLLWYKEKWTKKEWIGITIILATIFYTSLLK